jgi:hypothetical protein
MVQAHGCSTEDLGSGFGPDKAFGAAVVLGDVTLDGGLQLDDAGPGRA